MAAVDKRCLFYLIFSGFAAIEKVSNLLKAPMSAEKNKVLKEK